MTRDLSDETRALIRNALAAEVPPTHEHRSRLRRGVIARAAAAGGVALLLGSSVAKAGGKSLLLTALGSAGVGVGAGLVFAGAAHFAFDAPSAPEAAQSAQVARVAASRAAPARAMPVSSEPASVDEARPEPADVGEVGEPAPALAAAPRAVGEGRAAPVASAGSALRAELDLMTEVQSALRDGQGARSLDLLARYDARFPHGALTNERLAAEVFAACQTGDQPRAQRVAANFLQTDASSALAARVRNSCARGSAENGR
jgi:hypothetical protein